jgi:alanyl-tRNA synthetase
VVGDARVEAVFSETGAAEEIEEGSRGFVLLDRTPFYAESGGQVGDTGRITSQDGTEAEVEDTTAPAPGMILHHVRVLSGALKRGGQVSASVNATARAATMRNHTATHLLHAALKKVLGPEVQQAGSYVGPDRLRFDFNVPGPVSAEALEAIERDVNDQILRNTAVDKTERPYDEAIRGGAVALFGERYGERVRVVTVPGYSQELCGGTHCRGTGDIGQMIILSERGIAAGVRRIEALTGTAALERARENERILKEVESSMGIRRQEAGGAVAAMQAEVRALKKEADRLKLRLAQAGLSGGAAERGAAWEEVGGVRLLVRTVEGLDRSGMRTLADNLKREIGSGVVVLGSAGEGKVALLVAVTDDLAGRVDARLLMREIASVAGGAGGGRPTLAEAGGKHPDKLGEALGAGRSALARHLAQAGGA